jgi:hypothetical protein
MPKIKLAAIAVGVFILALSHLALAAPPPQNPQTGSVGLQGEIPSAPPANGATITVPGNGQNFTTTPITVAGSCPAGLLVEIFKNNVFSGSTPCNGGSFSLQIDLFDGKNDLVARVYDPLNQSGPDSNTVSVNFNANKPSPGPRIFLTSAYAKRGALPGATLSWPITLSGGAGPYAISIDWGDKSSPDLISRSFAGDFNVDHVYKAAGVYTVIMKATDVNGEAAFLQVVGVGNGPILQTGTNNKDSTTKTITKIIWWPLLIALVMIVSAFWLGRRNKVEEIRARLRKGLKPF